MVLGEWNKYMTYSIWNQKPTHVMGNVTFFHWKPEAVVLPDNPVKTGYPTGIVHNLRNKCVGIRTQYNEDIDHFQLRIAEYTTLANGVKEQP